MTRLQIGIVLGVTWTAIIGTVLAWLRGAAIAGERWDRTIADHEPSCLFGSCSQPAKWMGVSPSTLAHDETYPTYACDEHVVGLVAVRDLNGNYRTGDTRILADLDLGDQL